MKVYTTPQFNEEVKKLSSEDQKIVYRVFNHASKAAIKRRALLPSARGMTETGDNRIYEIRQRSIRIFSTIENIQGNESMVFIGVEKKTRSRPEFPSFVRSFNYQGYRRKPRR